MLAEVNVAFSTQRVVKHLQELEGALPPVISLGDPHIYLARAAAMLYIRTLDRQNGHRRLREFNQFELCKRLAMKSQLSTIR